MGEEKKPDHEAFFMDDSEGFYPKQGEKWLDNFAVVRTPITISDYEMQQAKNAEHIKFLLDDVLIKSWERIIEELGKRGFIRIRESEEPSFLTKDINTYVFIPMITPLELQGLYDKIHALEHIIEVNNLQAGLK